MSESLLNKTAVRAFILSRVKAQRPGWGCERVSDAAFDVIDANLRAYLCKLIDRQPTRGKTFRPEYGE
jgi:hypothetical protein